MTAPHVRRRRRERRARLRELGYASYDEYLRSPHWRALQARYRASGRPQVCMCGEEQVQLHHMTYERIGAELLTDLIALCRRCHAMVHELERRGELGLDLDGLHSPERAAAYADQRHAVEHGASLPAAGRGTWGTWRHDFTVDLVAWIKAISGGRRPPADIQTDLEAIGRALDRLEAKFV